jgi:hypothetical protein
VSTRVPPVTALRARPHTLDLAAPDEDALTIRVQLLEAWDAIRVRVAADEPVVSVKVRALEALDPSAEFHDAFVVKHRGIEILDEGESLAQAGVVNGATLLIMSRRRRPTREG